MKADKTSGGGPRAESPCVRCCTLDEKDICLGCFRHLDEICAWSAAADDERRAILERARGRGLARGRHG